MRILFVIDTLGPGGKERRMTELLKALRQDQGFEFELILMSNDIHYTEILDLGITIHKVIRRSRKDLSVFRSVYRIFRDYRPDIVHCWESMTAVYSAPTCWLLGIKLVNGMVIDTPVRRNILNKNWLRARLTFPLSSAVVGNSQAGLAAYRAPSGRSACIYNGINLSRFFKLREKSDVRKEIFGQDDDNFFIAGMVAAFDERKDYFTLIRAAIPLCRRHLNLRFALVGEGGFFAEVKDMIPDDLAGKIVLTGKRSDVESVINIFTIGLLLTETNKHGEGISNSIIEYMALAKPVIATMGGGTSEAVIDGETGFLVDPHNPDQIVRRIEDLIKDPVRSRKMGSAGSERVRNVFSITGMVKQYADLYSRLIPKSILTNNDRFSHKY